MKKPMHCRHGLCFLALAMLLWLGIPASLGMMPPQDRDNDTTRGQLAGFDRFLDSHPEVAEQLRRNPSLVDNREWVEKHPALQQFLQEHPGIREEIKENPAAFMKQEQRFDRHEDRNRR